MFYNKWTPWRYWKLLDSYWKVIVNFRRMDEVFRNFVDCVREGQGVPAHILTELDEVYPDNIFPGNRL